MQIHHPPDSPPVFDVDKVRALWAAAKADYLAGGSGPEVCERYGLILRTFRDRASKEGWRRADQPAPEPAPAAQNDRLVIPDAPSGAIRDGTEQPPPLTASEMVDKAWSHVQAAVAAGQLIQARGWLRLYKELKPFVRYEEIAAREARMEREATERRAAEEAADKEPLVIPEAPSGAVRDVAPSLHCFSAPESHASTPADEPISTSDLARFATRLATVAQQVEQAAHGETVRLPLRSFSPEESHHPGQGP